MLLSVSSFFSQEVELTKDCRVKLILYREDQFYFGFTYNTLKPAGVSQDKFSAGFPDMPINKDRTHAVAVGLGITYNNYIQNLAITGTGSCLYILLLTQNSI
jgi:hypothetical protein